MKQLLVLQQIQWLASDIVDYTIAIQMLYLFSEMSDVLGNVKQGTNKFITHAVGRSWLRHMHCGFLHVATV